MRQVPGGITAICTPRSPPFWRNARASWKSSQANLAAEDVAVGHRLAVAGFDDRDLAVGHDEERPDLHFVLPRPVAELQTGRERVGLQAGLAFERDDLAGRQVAIATQEHELLGDQADAVVRNDDDAEQPRDELPRRAPAR